MKFIRSRIAYLTAFSIICGCSDAKLERTDSSLLASQDPNLVSLLPPVQVDTVERLVLIMDMSNSAVQGSCPDEVDFPASSVSGKTCAPGFDPTGDRFQWAKTWIKNYASNPQIKDLKIMVVPFAGGAMTHPLPGTSDYKNMFFIPSDSALSYVGELEQTNDDTAKKFASGLADERSSLGTTIVYQGLDYASIQIEKEIQTLGPAAWNTRFDVVLISDGIPTPRKIDYEKILGPCKDADKALNSGDASCGGDFFACSVCANYISLVKRNLGDPAYNNPDQVWFKALGLVALPKYLGYGSRRLTLKLAQPHPENIQGDRNRAMVDLPDTPDKTDQINMLQYISSKLDIPIGVSSSAKPPFSLGETVVGGKTYRIQDFMVVNLNARVDSSGQLITDSDSDGVSDAQEFLNGTSPVTARTDGFCLDGISADFGCKKTGCLPKLDSDGDGLNACEEDTLGEDPYKIDSTGDGIPDLYKYFYKERLKADNQRADDSSDGVSNKQAFLFGALAGADLTSIASNLLVQTEMKYMGDVGTQPQYSLRIAQIPLVNTLAVTDEMPMYRAADLTPNTVIGKDIQLGGTPHEAGINQIVVLLRTVSVVDSNDIIYFIKRYDVPYGTAKIPPLDASTFKQLY